jgi:hypothetical protein
LRSKKSTDNTEALLVQGGEDHSGSFLAEHNTIATLVLAAGDVGGTLVGLLLDE